MSKMVDLRALAEEGAKIRLQKLDDERAAISRAFPGLLDPARKQKLRENMAKARAALAVKRKMANGGG